MTQAVFSFLTTGPQLSVELPNDFHPAPELTSPVLSGIGARSFDFLPSWLDSAVEEGEGFHLVDEITDADGRHVLVYEMDDPLQWFLRWDLSQGALVTHLREEDGRERIDILLKRLKIVEQGRLDLPFLFLEEPLAPFIDSRPGYQESATFLSRERSGWEVALRRPSFVRPGRIAKLPGQPAGSQAVMRAGASNGIEVQVMAGNEPEASALVSQISESLREAVDQ